MDDVRDESPTQFGPYLLVSLLGEGGMARVYRAVREGPEGFRKDVAIKRIRAGLTRDDDGLVRSLINEARLGGQLRHPNVVDTYEFGVVDDQHYIAMEFVHGLTLDALIQGATQRGIRLPRGAVLDLALQVCDGLDYAHSLASEDSEPLNLVHRDLKPSNIIVSTAGQAKIMDFGVARSRASPFQTSRADIAKGTLNFMSPEQLDDPLGLDHRSDLFALGAVLFQALTGEELIDAPTTHAAMWQIVSGEYRHRLAQVDEVFPEIRSVLARCLEPDRERRYPDADAVGDELRAIRDHTGYRLGCRELMLLVVAALEGPDRLDQVREKVLSGGSGEDANTDWPTFVRTLDSDVELERDSLRLKEPSPISSTTLSGPLARPFPDPTRRANVTVMWRAEDTLPSSGVRAAPPGRRRATGWIAAVMALVGLVAVGIWRPWSGPAVGGRAGTSPTETPPPADDPAPSGGAAWEAREDGTPVGDGGAARGLTPVPATDGAATEPAGETRAKEVDGEVLETGGADLPSRADAASPDGPPQLPPSPAPDEPGVAVFINSVPWSTYILSGDADQTGNTPFNQVLPAGSYHFLLKDPQSGELRGIPVIVDGTESGVSHCWSFLEDGPC